MNQKLLSGAVALACALQLDAKITLPQLFQDGMVVQRGQAIPVWGTANAGEQVTVVLNKKYATVTADGEGRWRVNLPAMKAGGPFVLEVRGSGNAASQPAPTTGARTATGGGTGAATSSTGTATADVVTLSNVMVGDVWLLSGQSNIDVTVERVYPWYTTDIDTYENPNVRLFRVQNETDTHAPRTDIRPTRINWKPANKQNAWLFSAVGYFLGRRMYEKSGVAQGVIVNSWGGTPIEAWIGADSLKAYDPLLVEKTRIYDNGDFVSAQQRANQQANQQWNRMLNELDPGMATVKSATAGSKDEYLFTSLTYDDSQWQEVSQWNNTWAYKHPSPTTHHPSPVTHHPSPIIGSIWLRQHVTVDKTHAGQPARLLLGTLFDADQTYVNGQLVGTTGYQYPPRRYDLPAGLLREGDNVITVRFINKYGTAHFIKEKPYLIAFGDDRQSLNPLPKDVIKLSETWKHHEGALMPSCPSGDVSLQNLPTTLYNAVLHPLAPYAVAGVVWYQGESNTGNAAPYERLLTMMIGNWRALWQRPELPFTVVQLANYMEPSEQPQNTGWSVLREAQRQVALKLDNVELASAIDLGETVDIHPLRKREVADRIGLCFDRLVYKDKKVKLMPQIVDRQVTGKTITLTFDQSLRPCAELHELEVAGDDGRFHNAEGRAEGNRIVITSPVDNPRRVRHAWKNNPIRLNAYSAEGLPVGPFEETL